MSSERPAAGSTYRLRTWGSPALLDEAGEPVSSLRRKDLALLVYLRLDTNRFHGRSQLASLLWAGVREDRARHSLTQALGRIRRVLGDDAFDASVDVIHWRTPLWCDAAELERGAEDCRDAVGPVGVDIDLGGADFLEAFDPGDGAREFQRWADRKRTHYRNLAIHYLDTLGVCAERCGDWPLALRLGQRLTALEPIFEEGHRRAMRAWAATGERALALQHYERFAAWLREELEEEPDPRTEALARRIDQEEAVPGAPALAGTSARDSAGASAAAAAGASAGEAAGASIRSVAGSSIGTVAGSSIEASAAAVPPATASRDTLASGRSRGVGRTAGIRGGPVSPLLWAAIVLMAIGLTSLAGLVLIGSWSLVVLLQGSASPGNPSPPEGGGPLAGSSFRVEGQPVAWSDSAALPGNGEYFTVAGTEKVYLAFAGLRWKVPDPTTLSACTGGFPGLVREVPSMPPLRSGGTLPTMREHPWMAGQKAVMLEGDTSVFALVGCVRSAIPTRAVFETIFGLAGWRDVVEVPDSLLRRTPRGPEVMVPLRRAGTVLWASGTPRLLWVTHSGGGLRVVAPKDAAFYCRGDLVAVDRLEFASYTTGGTLPIPAHGGLCGGSGPPRMYAADLHSQASRPPTAGSH